MFLLISNLEFKLTILMTNIIVLIIIEIMWKIHSTEKCVNASTMLRAKCTACRLEFFFQAKIANIKNVKKKKTNQIIKN